MGRLVDEARVFMFTHARLLERILFDVRFASAPPAGVARMIRAYQNPDGGLGHALEPDVRCPESQPLFVAMGLHALWEAGCQDQSLALSLCDYLATVSDGDGLVPFMHETAQQWPRAGHWMAPSSSEFAPARPGLNPTADICGLLHYQGVAHPWLGRATATCIERITQNPPLEAHTLLGAAHLAAHLKDRPAADRLFAVIADALPKASFFIANAPVQGYGLTPLHFAPTPASPWRRIFTEQQIQGHLHDLLARRQTDGGWPITWQAPGPAATLEWRGRVTFEAVATLAAYGCDR